MLSRSLRRFRQANQDVEAAVAFEQRASLAPADGGGHGVLDVGHVQPIARGFWRSIFTVGMGKPVVCSTLTSDAPGIFCNMDEISSPVLFRTSMSSPKIFTATSLRTPEMSSLRNWIGCENS